MKFFLIAGEASGDLHGSKLVQALRREMPGSEFRCWGGDLMAAEGAIVTKHYRELAFMGFLEVVKNLPEILCNFKKIKSEVIDFQPDALILIDYPGFNLRMATWAKKQGLRVFYYISPQLWAWHVSRVRIVREAVERMFVIFPFEEAFYKKHGVEAEFIGHPLKEAIAEYEAPADFFEKNGLDKGKPIIALLPGSRRQEIRRMLGMMTQMPQYFPDYQFVIAGAPSIERDFYEPLLEGNTRVKLVAGQTYALLKHAEAALVTSGTATLETALFKVPQVVCYRGNALSYFLAKMLVNRDLKFISMVNLVAGKKVVTELIQDELTVENLKAELEKLLDGKVRRIILQQYSEVSDRLGAPGAATKAARSIRTILASHD